MTTNTFAMLVVAMIQYLQSTGLSRQELARYADLPGDAVETPNQLSAAQLQRLWQLIQARLSASFSFSLRVRPLIAAQLARGRVHVETVAAQLNMSRHTLYKRLKAENLTFADLLDEVRKEQALTYLRESPRSLAEIGDLLGFSELSAFSRAFKRWMGVSPAEFRAAGR